MADNINSRSQAYAVARGRQRCENCTRFTPVLGLVLFAGHETLESGAEADEGADEDSDLADVWEPAETPALLFFVESIPESVQRRLLEFSQHYSLEYDEQADQSYWMNHCAFCGAKQRDFELYCEPEGAFMPISEAGAAFIKLCKVPEPFEALAGGYMYESEFPNDDQLEVYPQEQQVR
jgi:hypothetical protein